MDTRVDTDAEIAELLTELVRRLQADRARLEKEIKDIDAKIRKAESRISVPQQTREPAVVSIGPSRTPPGHNSNLVREFFLKRPGKAFRLKDVCDALGLSKSSGQWALKGAEDIVERGQDGLFRLKSKGDSIGPENQDQ